MATILIIDDDDRTASMCSAMLRAAGYETIITRTAEIGVELATNGSFDVILVDSHLPGTSGVDVVRTLKQRDVPSHVVLVTTCPSYDSSFAAAVAGAVGYIDGPLIGDEVVQVVSQAINGERPVRHPRQLPASEHIKANGPNKLMLDPRVRNILEMIETELAEPFPIAELARRVNLSPSGLRHLVKASIGTSLTMFRMWRRIDVVARRLTTTHESISQIAYGVGFRSPSLRHFRKRFREKFGMSPKAYRLKCWRGE